MKITKIFLNLSLFCFGLSLAVVLVQSRFFMPNDTSVSLNSSSVTDTIQGIGNNFAMAEESSRINERREEIQRILTPEMFLAAVDEATLESLQIIRPEWIKTVKDYDRTVIPLVKREALKTLLSKFSERDWSDWPRAALNLNGKPTAARRFVDDMRTVNQEMGNYLETAAILLFNLQKSTISARPYDAKSDLEDVLLNAESILALRNRPAISARSLLDATIANDQIFLSVLEQKRSEFVVKYLHDNPGKFQEQLDLLTSLNGAALTKSVFQSVGDMLRNVALDSSPLTRAKLLEAEERTQAIHKLAATDTKINHTLAQLYVIAALDALEQQDKALSQRQLTNSLTLQTGLASQKLLSDQLDNLTREHRTSGTPPEKIETRTAILTGKLPKTLGYQPKQIAKKLSNRLDPFPIEQNANEQLSNQPSGIAILPVLAFLIVLTFVGIYFYRTRFLVTGPKAFHPPVMNDFKAQANEYLSLGDEDEGELERTRSRAEKLPTGEAYQEPKIAVG